jgi:tetrahydromethanopterin S-methyltransferase subunit G
MSDEPTKETTEARSFEDRVFARFDAMDARLTALEQKIDARAFETKPIWERALAEILEVRHEAREIVKRLDRIESIVLQTRADTREVEDRVTLLESRQS